MRWTLVCLSIWSSNVLSALGTSYKGVATAEESPVLFAYTLPVCNIHTPSYLSPSCVPQFYTSTLLIVSLPPLPSQMTIIHPFHKIILHSHNVIKPR